MSDPVNNPAHYNSHPSGIECITITQHMSFCLGNAMKYIWRADFKGDAIMDLEKAVWYIECEIRRRRLEHAKQSSAAKELAECFTDTERQRRAIT